VQNRNFGGILLGALFASAPMPVLSDGFLAGNYRGIYAYCANNYPCSEADFEKYAARTGERNTRIVIEMARDGEDWQAYFTSPPSWKSFGGRQKAYLVTVADKGVEVRANGDNAKAVFFTGESNEGLLAGKLEYNGYTMHARLTRE